MTSIELNASQRKAVDDLAGQLVISAGAGSGKTRVLAARFVNAVDPGAGVPDWEPAATDAVLTITYTDKAAAELSERIRSFLAVKGLHAKVRELDGAWISTIHGFCARILRAHALEAGIDPQFVVASTVQAGTIADEAFEAAARRALADDPSATELAGIFGIERVNGAVRDIHARLRARGASADDVVLEPVASAREILCAAIDLFESTNTCFLEQGDSSKSGDAHNLDVCQSALDMLRDVDLSGLREETAIARDVRRALGSGKLYKTCSKELKPTVVESCEAQQALGRQAAAVILHRPAEAFVRMVGAFAEEYARRKKERGLLDFDDLQSEALRVLESRPDIAERYRKMFRLVMIDEFQDTNELQSRLVNAVTDSDLCTVGDINQAIYGFRYADVRVFEVNSARMVAEGATEVPMFENYRSHPDVLRFINAAFKDDVLLGPGFEGLIPKASPDAERLAIVGPRVRALFVDATRDAESSRRTEAEALASEIQGVVDSGVPLGDIALLVRAYTHAETYAAALRRRGYPVLVAGGDFLRSPEVASLRSVLRLAVNRRDREAAGMLLTGPLVGVSDDGLRLLSMVDGRTDLAAGIVRWADAGLGEVDFVRVARGLGAVDRVTDLAGTVRVADLIVAAVESFDLDLSAAAGGPDEARVLGNALKLARLARDVESAQGGGLPGFLHHLDLQEHFGERQSPAAVVDGRTPAIRVMSIHSAKGLEFPVVAVPGLGSQTGSSNSDRHRLGSGESPYALALALPDDGAGERTTPSFEALKQDAAERDEREDRRLFYVACTRAEKMLILSGAVNLAKPKAGDAMSTWVKWIRRVLGLDEGALTPGETTVHLGSDVKVVVVSHVPPEGEGPVATDVSPAVRAASTAGAPAASAGPEPCGGPAFVMPAEISYTDIATFESCPLKFRAMRSLGLPGVPPDSPLDPLTFGKAVHAVLSIGEGLTGAAREERLAAIARGHRLDAEGRARLDAAVEGFRSSRAAAVLRKADSVSREAPFAVALGDTRLTGFLDAIGWVGDHCTIVDYKTGTGASDDDEALNRRYRRQAECYGLAALVAGADAVEVAFVRVEDLDDDGAAHEVVFAWKQADVDEVRRSVADAAEAIAAGVFKPLDTYQPGACDGCAVAGGLCPVYVPTALDARR